MKKSIKLNLKGFIASIFKWSVILISLTLVNVSVSTENVIFFQQNITNYNITNKNLNVLTETVELIDSFRTSSRLDEYGIKQYTVYPSRYGLAERYVEIEFNGSQPVVITFIGSE